MRRTPVLLFTTMTLLAGMAGGCATAPKSASARETLSDNVQTTIKRFQREKPELAEEMRGAAGYAVFPTIGKGGIGVGGAYGRGMLYQRGEPAGFCDVTQATIGFQLGGQSYAELILIEDDAALARFKNNTAQVRADASAVALTTGAHGRAQFNNGMAIYTLTNGGLMYEATVGGQRFTYAATEAGFGDQGTPASATTPQSTTPQSSTPVPPSTP